MNIFLNTYGLRAINWENYNNDWFFPRKQNERHWFVDQKACELFKKTLGGMSLGLIVLEYAPGLSALAGASRIAAGLFITGLALARRICNAKAGRADGSLLQDEALLTGITQIARGAIALIPFGLAVNATLDIASTCYDCLRGAQAIYAAGEKEERTLIGAASRAVREGPVVAEAALTDHIPDLRITQTEDGDDTVTITASADGGRVSVQLTSPRPAVPVINHDNSPDPETPSDAVLNGTPLTGAPGELELATQ